MACPLVGLCMTDLVERLVPDELWELFQRVVPPTEVRRPQGGGRRRAGDREVLAAVVLVATSGWTWRQLPPVFGPAWQTVYRRFAQWSADRVWARLHRVVLDELGARGGLDWSRCAIDCREAGVRRKVTSHRARLRAPAAPRPPAHRTDLVRRRRSPPTRPAQDRRPRISNHHPALPAPGRSRNHSRRGGPLSVLRRSARPALTAESGRHAPLTTVKDAGAWLVPKKRSKAGFGLLRNRP